MTSALQFLWKTELTVNTSQNFAKLVDRKK